VSVMTIDRAAGRKEGGIVNEITTHDRAPAAL